MNSYKPAIQAAASIQEILYFHSKNFVRIYTDECKNFWAGKPWTELVKKSTNKKSINPQKSKRAIRVAKSIRLFFCKYT